MSIKKAISKGDVQGLKALIAQGADVNMKFLFGSTPLHYAAEKNQAECARVLIQAGADVNIREPESQGARTPLHNTALFDSPGVAVVLLENGAQVDPVDSHNYSTPLHYCTDRAGHPKVAEVLISHKASVNKHDKYGNTALHLAAVKGHIDIILLLLNNGAQINTQDQKGDTPLDQAHDRGYENIAQLLISRGGKTGHELKDKLKEK